MYLEKEVICLDVGVYDADAVERLHDVQDLDDVVHARSLRRSLFQLRLQQSSVSVCESVSQEVVESLSRTVSK